MNSFYLKTNIYEPWHNLAVEQYLSTLVRRGDVILYLWQNERTVVIGRNQNALTECRAKLLEDEGGYLARRTTGGGAVYHDLGNLCFTFLASPEVYDQEKQFLVVMDACASFGLQTRLSGRNDVITEDGFKFSGNAFSHTSACDIHHGTIMVDVNVEDMKRYLTPSARKLKAKGIRSVRSRVCNLRALCPEVTVDALCRALRGSFAKIYAEPRELDPALCQSPQVDRIRARYASWEWRYGKSPDCESSCRTRFDWGEVEVWFRLHGLGFERVKVFSDSLDPELPGMVERLLSGKRYDLPLEEMPASASVFGSDEDWTPQRKEQAAQVAAWLRRELLG